MKAARHGRTSTNLDNDAGAAVRRRQKAVPVPVVVRQPVGIGVLFPIEPVPVAAAVFDGATVLADKATTFADDTTTFALGATYR